LGTVWRRTVLACQRRPAGWSGHASWSHLRRGTLRAGPWRDDHAGRGRPGSPGFAAGRSHGCRGRLRGVRGDVLQVNTVVVGRRVGAHVVPSRPPDPARHRTCGRPRDVDEGVAEAGVQWRRLGQRVVGGPWDVDPTTINCPVLLWYGAEDRFCSPTHGVWLRE